MSETPTYRLARAGEIDEIARLAGHSFPGPVRTFSWWQEQLRDPPYGGGADTLLVGDIASRKVAACQLHALRQWIAGEALPVAGVGTVVVSPTHRRRGLGARIMTAGFRLARERGDVASALYPFRATFYRNLGYGAAGGVLQYRVPPQSLADAAERQRVELLDTEALRDEALALYRRWAPGQTGQLDRTEQLWARVLARPDQALVGYRAPDGALEGYALVVYRADLPPAERFLEVEELVWESPDARRGLYAWLSSLGDQWQQIVIRALPSHRLDDWLAEARLPHGAAPSWRLWEPAATLLTGLMFRLLDLPAAWQRRRVVPGAPLTATLEVSDRQIEENSGSWRLVLEQGRASLERGSDPRAALRLDVATLSRLYVGALAPTAAFEAGLLECGRPELLAPLDDALRLPEPWTFDRF